MQKEVFWRELLCLLAVIAMALSAGRAYGQEPTADWQGQVRKYAAAHDWDRAMQLVDEEIARAPQDMDVRAWRAHVLAWSDRLTEAEQEYLEILKLSGTDPDIWTGLAGIYLREGKLEEAQKSSDTAEELDPKRADLHAARARILRAAGKQDEARLEFERALSLDPTSREAREGLISVRSEPKHELRFGQDNDVFNFVGPNHDEWVSLLSRWTSRWTTNVVGDFYQRGGAGATKFMGSVARHQPKWGTLTVGGAIGHDNSVIPKSEAFFDLDHGWRVSETDFVRGIEFTFDQHWYWYQSARILALNGNALLYLPREWTFSLGATRARSAFSGTAAEWRSSGVSRLGFPLAIWGDKRLSGNVFFAAGTENYEQVDQIGQFASQTYGGGLRYQIVHRQEVTGYAAFQKRTQGKTDTSVGLSYAILF